MSATDPMQMSEAELRAMTGDLDAMHHDVAMPALKAGLGEWADDIRASAAAARPSALARRRFLAAAGGAAGAALLAACSGSASSSSSGDANSALADTTGSGEGQHLAGDLLVAGLAASLESSGIATYAGSIADAKAGKFGSVPPAMVTFAETVMSQHQDHRKAWNAMLTSAGKKPVTAVDPVLQPKIDEAYSEVTSVTELTLLALMVETVAGATYQNALTTIKSAVGIKTAAAIEPVEFQHVAILNFMLGGYPVTAAFTATTSARLVKDYRT
jgi:Ferritin-like domain